MRVRIKATPKEREIDGLSLRGLHPGEVREVSPLVGSWLIAEEYAEPEMRRPAPEGEFRDRPLELERRRQRS